MKVSAPKVLLSLLAIILAGTLLLPQGGSHLPGEGRQNPLRSLWHHIAFTWHFSRYKFREFGPIEESRSVDLAHAVWYRPSFSQQAFGISSSDYLGLARKFANLGLAEKAGLLYLAAHQENLGRDQAIISILGCAGLKDWKNVSRIAEESTILFPDFADGYYWWGRALIAAGRPRDALAKLSLAGRLNPDSGDITYWQGIALQSLGENEKAASAFRETVAAHPFHRKAWKALAEMYRETDIIEGAREAEYWISSLTAVQEFNSRFGEGLVFLGVGDLPPTVRGNEEYPLSIYCTFMPGAAGVVYPYLRFRSGPFQKKITMAPISFAPISTGEVLVKSFRPFLPWDIVPLPTEVLIGFLDESGVPLPILQGPGHELKLGEVEISAKLFSAPDPAPFLSELPGNDLTDLRKKTALAGSEVLELEISDSGVVAAIGIVSYTEGTITFPQGMKIAAVALGGDGSPPEYPIRLGLDTADRWLESRDPHITRHQVARIIYSHQDEAGNFQWHYYLCLLPLPEPMEVSSLTLRYLYPGGGSWIVKNIFLLGGGK